jgi:UDP-glucose 4-epimerase
MKERVLITGASGFVGFHLIEAALKSDLEVYAAVRKSSNVKHLKKLDIKYTYPNYEDVDSLIREIRSNKYDYIIHAAGITKALTPKDYLHINADYTQNLARAAVATGQIKKFVLLSSLAAAGPLPTMEGEILETGACLPVTAYGKSKLLAEKRLFKFDTLNFTILRPTAVYGPRDKDILIVLKQFASRFEPYIGKVQQQLSFIYVKDLAKVSIQALHKGGRKTYHIADGKVYDRYQLANITKRLLSVKTLKVHLPVFLIKSIAATAEVISMFTKKASPLNVEKLNELTAVNWACSIEEAKRDLSFEPQYDLQQGLEETLTWYKESKWL